MSGQVCDTGAFVASCGDGTCDCGENAGSCPVDCAACTMSGCRYQTTTCIAKDVCEPGDVGQICMAGTFTSSCGNGKCDCGETRALCPGDCP
jgi:hypothetical protein